MPTRADALAIMAKAPIAGAVKTRLAPPLTQEQAAELSRALLVDQLNHLSGLNSAELYLAFAPEDARAMMTELVPPRFRLFAQRGDDLGARMNGVFDWLRAKGHRNMVLIGGDLAPVPLRNLAETFTALEVAGERVVLGPSRDGGYYLVGMNRLTPQIFDGMTWSHDRVLAQTTAKLSASRIEFQLLPTWFDIDTIEDLRELKSHIGPECRAAMKQTLDLLRHLRIGEGGARLKS
jgi:rSAM/selenodomain-associated transferase 1